MHLGNCVAIFSNFTEIGQEISSSIFILFVTVVYNVALVTKKGNNFVESLPVYPSSSARIADFSFDSLVVPAVTL